MEDRMKQTMNGNAMSSRPIQRVLRHKHSRQYFTGNGWTDRLEEARFLRDSLEAAELCAQCELSGVEMVLRLQGAVSDLYCVEFT